MSRRARSRGRKNFKSKGGLTLTVAAVPTAHKTDPSISLENELRLLRSSLLYADSVDLISSGAMHVWTLIPLRGVDTTDPLRSLTRLHPQTLERMGVEKRDVVDFRRKVAALRTRPKSDLQRVEFEKEWTPALETITEIADSFFRSAAAPELEAAMDDGGVTLIDTGKDFEAPIPQQISAYKEAVLRSLKDPHASVLLDRLTTRMVREKREPHVQLSSAAEDRSKRAVTGTGLVERLPVFPEASMHEILEVREELAEYRSRFRVSVRKLASELKSSAFEESLSSEIDEMWHDIVRPDIEELRQAVSFSRLVRDTGRTLVTEGFGIPTIAVALVNLPDLAAMLPTATGLVTGAGRIASAGIGEAIKAHGARKKHDMVYLLEVEKHLSKR